MTGPRSAAQPRETRVRVADYAVGRGSGVITTVGLGSCVAILLHDRAFDEAAFADTPSELRSRYFTPGVPSRIDPAVRAMIDLERRDLLRDEPPHGGLHLIACRNVVIYFDRPTQEALFERFHAALRPGGFLVLGKVETLVGPARTMFAPVDARERIFRRL